MITCKESVRFRVIRRELLHLLQAADLVFNWHHLDCVVTSGTDSHPPDDPHFNGYAADFRTHHITDPGVKAAIVTQLQTEAGDDYYVFLEAPGTPNEHIHAQTRKGLWQQLMDKEGKV
jgi:hypothetical protein